MEFESACPRCGHKAFYYDSVQRKVKTKHHRSYWIDISRHHCLACGHYYRILPSFLVPFKLYEREIIRGFVSGELDNSNLDYNGYPDDDTIVLWRASQSLQAL